MTATTASDFPEKAIAAMEAKVAKWFEEATGGQPYRPRTPRIPTPVQLNRIASGVLTFKKAAAAPVPKAELVSVTRLVDGSDRLAIALSDAMKALDSIFQCFEPKGTIPGPAPEELVKLRFAIQAADAGICGLMVRPRTGRPRAPRWHRAIWALRRDVESALEPRDARNPSGYATKVLWKACSEIYPDIDITESAVRSCLERSR